MGIAADKEMKSFFQKFWPVLVIVSLWLIFSFPYFARGLVPFPSTYLATFFPPWSSEYGMPVKNNAMPDVITQIYPWKKLTIDAWKLGQVPLWNPYSFSGTAHAGNYQSAVFSPFNLIFFILPFIDAWSLFILLQPLLAGLLMYMFVRSLDRSREAALLAAIAFMFCGFMVVWMAYGTLGYAALYLLLIFWGIHGYSQKPSRLHIFAISLGTTLSLVSGHFQVSVYVIIASLAYILWKKKLSALWYVILGVCIAAPQILLGLRTFALSTRGAAVLKGEIIPWKYLLTLIAPDFFGNPVTRNDWFGHYAEWAGFVGVIPLLLAVYAVTKKRIREGWFFVLLAIVSLLFALPTPLNDLLYVLKIPILSGSAASRIIILTSFSLAVLSAYGLDGLIADWKNNKRNHSMVFAVVCMGFIALTWVILLFGNTLPVDKLAIAKHNFVMPSAFVLVGAMLFVLGSIRKKWLRMILLYVILLASAFDVLRFAIKWMPFDPRQYVYPEVKSLTYLASRVGNDRVFGNIGSGEVGTAFRIPLVEGYDAVYQARYGEFISAVSKGYIYPGSRSVVQFDKYGLYKTEALQLLGIKYIYHRFSDGRNIWVFPYWEYLADGSMHQIYSDEKYEIFEYNNVYPRAFLASSYEVETVDQKILDRLFAPGFNRRDSLVLEEKPRLEPAPGSGTAVIRDYEPTRVTIQTTSDSPKLLFLSDVYDTGWQARVDGALTPIYRADYDFRSVSVPAGAHTVQFIYQPQELRWGILLSIAGLGILIWSAVKKRI
jgi:hypothetical protein